MSFVSCVGANTEVLEIALLILSSAAFGRHNSWRDHSVEEEEVDSPTAHRIPFRPAVTSAVENLVFVLCFFG